MLRIGQSISICCGMLRRETKLYTAIQLGFALFLFVDLAWSKTEVRNSRINQAATFDLLEVTFLITIRYNIIDHNDKRTIQTSPRGPPVGSDCGLDMLSLTHCCSSFAFPSCFRFRERNHILFSMAVYLSLALLGPVHGALLTRSGIIE